MKYVEFFEKTSIENLCACLNMLPDEVILVGDSASAMKRHIANYQNVFEGRGQNIKFSYKVVSRWNTKQVVEVLEEIVESGDECRFGITGGDELSTFALGIVCERHKEKKIQVHKISIQNNTIYDCDMDGETIEHGAPELTVRENVQIYGGKVIVKDESNPYGWVVTPEFVEDVDKMWDICKSDPRDWNTHAGIFDYLKHAGTVSEDMLTVEVKTSEIENYCKKQKGDYEFAKALMEKLHRIKMISIIEKEDKIVLTYKNEQVRECLSKAGQVLEMKIYLTAIGLGIYNDAMTGVEIDWDGKIHHAEDGVYDTMNEIDVLLMHGMVPVFISCKNGDVTSDELYKVHTVAERFGGKYAKKVLIVTAMPGSKGGKLLEQRAKDMDIKIITGNDLLDDKKLKAKLTNMIY